MADKQDARCEYVTDWGAICHCSATVMAAGMKCCAEHGEVRANSMGEKVTPVAAPPSTTCCVSKVESGEMNLHDPACEQNPHQAPPSTDAPSDRDEVKLLEQDIEMSSGNRFEVWATTAQPIPDAHAGTDLKVTPQGIAYRPEYAVPVTRKEDAREWLESNGNQYALGSLLTVRHTRDHESVGALEYRDEFGNLMPLPVGVITRIMEAYAAPFKARAAALEKQIKELEEAQKFVNERLNTEGMVLFNYPAIPQGCRSNIQWRNTRAEAAEKRISELTSAELEIDAPIRTDHVSACGDKAIEQLDYAMNATHDEQMAAVFELSKLVPAITRYYASPEKAREIGYGSACALIEKGLAHPIDCPEISDALTAIISSQLQHGGK